MILTTITPYWRRPRQLQIWLEALKGAAHPEVTHLLYVVGSERLPVSLNDYPNVQVVRCADDVGLSIGHYHNEGAKRAETEWMMKLDVDCLPNVQYFQALLGVLETARPREWFNGGMFYVNKVISATRLQQMPLQMLNYMEIMSNRSSCSASSYLLPAASNFICRRQEYLDLGGCLADFRGYGWEDYQQLYMLERHWRQADPLPGQISQLNITGRCRDEISRPKARELWERDSRLCLLHVWHKGTSDPRYHVGMVNNRRLLFDYVLRQRADPFLKFMAESV